MASILWNEILFIPSALSNSFGKSVTFWPSNTSAQCLLFLPLNPSSYPLNLNIPNFRSTNHRIIPNVWGFVVHLARGGPCFLETKGPKFHTEITKKPSKEKCDFKNFGKIITNQGKVSLFATNCFCKLSIYPFYQLETSLFLVPIKDGFFLCWITIPAPKTRCTLRQPIWTARPIWRPRWCEIRHSW